MAKLPAAPVRIGKGIDPGSPQEPIYGHACHCGAPAAHWHHIVRRSHLGGPFNSVEIDGLVWPNVMPVCFSCHETLERNEAYIALPRKEEDYAYIFWWLEPAPEGQWKKIPLDVGLGAAPVAEPHVERDGLSSSESPSPAVPLTPGQKCDTCGRKVPHPRKPTSPESKVKSLRVPTDELQAYTETLEACQEHLGVAGQPYAPFKTIILALGLLLQHESLKDFGARKVAA